ncbi:BadF/BadG/BcrA/BcrD ATPase family protein [Nonomuraea roseoviolacea]|uniref:N-acetylglucosamine kinase-like BadF-type ATPase n=1 Tax=Nonomuraea roseoviolacea subsp. carminata TaxID=160689 RepID=A0ABT1KFQ4_9ACTN|nr:BadF/BadG/BcrA/BcrD ATPase family protein [Nonomuraea roseoviolacea]MCP2352191.1 N-acetylglucosamine kinase-like BadF-type ATPase [Nonomuraea roseoviolacea subsp. carminata]
MTLFAGVDAGGTTTRAAVHAPDGTRLGYGTAGPGNPAAHGAAAAGAAIGRALRRALDGLDPALVAASVAGVAGADDAFGEVLGRVWASCGVASPPRLVGDVDVAYAAGTAEPSGTLLLAGTGAAAARFSGRAVVAVADGLGWLLGDEGGGFWIGRAGVRAAVRALDGGGPYGPLVELICAHFGVTGVTEVTDVAWVTGVPGVTGVSAGSATGAAGESRRRADRIVRLAQADRTLVAAASPLVAEAAAAGDAGAAAIVGEAARRLAATAGRVLGPGPVVLAGGVLTGDGPVRTAVTALLAGREVLTARDGAGAASWLAALDRLGDAGAHARFTTESHF